MQKTNGTGYRASIRQRFSVAPVDIMDEEGTTMLPVKGGMGNDRYTLIDIDHDDQEINVKKAVHGIHGAWVSDGN